MIEILNVSKSYSEGLRSRKVLGVQNLNLSIIQGEVFGFLGPNGAGKSTTIKLLLDLIRPDQGRIRLNGMPVSQPNVRRQVGYLPENPYFYDYLSAQELLWFGGRSNGMSAAEIRLRGTALLEKFDLQQAAGRRLRTYSKGMVQRAGLALALIHDPQVIILDEPMSGLDPLGRKMVVDLILDLKRQGKTVFFSSHVLADVERICDRVGIIARGQLQCVCRLDALPNGAQSLEELFIDTVTSVSSEVLA